LELFFLIMEGAIRVGASVKCYLICADQWRYVPDESWHALQWTTDIGVLQSTELPRLPELSRLPLRSLALRYLISDLLFPEGTPAPLYALNGREGKGIIVAPFSKTESEPKWQGNHDFIDAEAKTTHPYRVERSLLARYLDAYRQHFQWW